MADADVCPEWREFYATLLMMIKAQIHHSIERGGYVQIVAIYAYLGAMINIGWKRNLLLYACTIKKARQLSKMTHGSVRLSTECLRLIDEPIPYCPALSRSGQPCGNVCGGRWCKAHKPLRNRRFRTAECAVRLLRRVLPVNLVNQISAHLHGCWTILDIVVNALYTPN
jgi:hypothetical protein